MKMPAGPRPPCLTQTDISSPNPRRADGVSSPRGTDPTPGAPASCPGASQRPRHQRHHPGFHVGTAGRGGAKYPVHSGGKVKEKGKGVLKSERDCDTDIKVME